MLANETMEKAPAFSLSFQAPGREASTHQLSSLVACGSPGGTQVKLTLPWGGAQDTAVPALSNPLLCSSFPQNKTHHTSSSARIPEEPNLPQNCLESRMNKTKLLLQTLDFIQNIKDIMLSATYIYPVLKNVSES